MSERESLKILLDALASRGDRPAIVEVRREGSRDLAYGELAARVAALARGIAASGIDREERVAMLAAPDAAWVSIVLGLLRRGAIAVPLDTQLDAEQIERIVGDAGIECVVADEERLETLERAAFQGQVVRIDPGEDDDGSWRRWLEGEGDLPEHPQAGDTALLFYTSGTTGPPKGVPLKHEHLAFQVRSVAKAGVVTEDDRLLLPMPLHHVYPLVMGVLAPLHLGLPVIFPAAISGPELIRAVRESEATVIVGVPRLYTALLDGVDRRLDEQPWPARAALRGLWALSTALRHRTRLNAGALLMRPLRKRLGESLRVMASGGSPLSPDTARRMEGLGWEVAVGYGLTETSPLLTLNPPGAGHLDTVGRPIEDIDIRIDDAAGPEEGDGGKAGLGEILARGPGVFDGYLNLDEETEKSFTDDGWYRTGDLGWLDDDGYLHVVGRKSTMIVTAGGENIRTEALEERYEEEPLLAEVGILLDDEELVGVIHPDPETARKQPDELDKAVDAALRRVSKSLPSYQRLSRYRISGEALERTRLGKLKRHKLKERYRQLGQKDDARRGEPVSPEDMEPEDRELLDNERARKTWDLLADRYSAFRLTPDSSFQLDLGIDSLGWFDLTIALAQRTGVELREQDIEALDSVRDMLKAIAGREGGGGELVTPLERPREVLSDEQKKWLEPLSQFSRAVAAVLDGLNRLLMKAMFRLRIAGRPLPDDGPVVLAPNHTSVIDPFAVAAAVPAAFRRNLFWGGWTGMAFRNAVFRWFSGIGRVVPVDPDRSVISSLAFAAAILREGHSLTWFPEGERSESGELGPLRPGIGALLEQFPQVRVVPVRIDGAFEAWPMGRRLPRPKKITVVFGEALSPGQLEDRGRGDSRRAKLMDGLRDAMESTGDD